MQHFDELRRRVICVSWDPALSLTRQMLLGRLGCRVVSALGEAEALDACRAVADLMILGHSVPRSQKRKVIECFRRHSRAPVLSLISPNEEKLPEATHVVDAGDPELFLRTVRKILLSAA
jgi:CheY-like chemotaxis protein